MSGAFKASASPSKRRFMRERFEVALIVAAVIFSHSGLASASVHKRAGGMAEGAYVLPPISFTRFCLTYPGECVGAGARVHVNAERMRILEEVNRSVNLAIAPRADAPFHDWRLGVSQGDCNNYAVQKRHELIAQGWPAGALALSVVKTRSGEGHLVVAVRTDRGDYVLDNLRSHVVDWRSAGYRWLMRQSERNPKYWVALNGWRSVSKRTPHLAEEATSPSY